MKKVVVAGAGLAGLTVAKLLAERGFSVTVLESSPRVGGKAGADQESGVWREHGYHIFPPWYVNTRPILASLGVRLVDFDRWHYLREGEQDRPVSVPVPRNLATMVEALRAKVFPWQEALLYGYLAIDTLGEPMKAAALLDQVSRIGLMRSRWYVTDAMPEFEQENLLKASAIPAHDMSAMTVKIVFSNWIRAIQPFLSILPGDLQTTFVEPYAQAARNAGATIRLNEPITQVEVSGGRISAFVSRLSDGTVVRHPGDAFVFTTPLEVTRRLIGGDLQALDPELGNMEHLHAAPMAALHLDLDHRLPWTPPEHVVLHQGRYGLSFIDLAHHWPGMTNSSLSFIASNFIPLRDLTADEQYEALFGEIRRYLNIRPGQVVAKSLKPNVDVPLFINTVGAWPNRPKPRAEQIPNLYLAGDWARNHVDLACMEGAICSAMDTARMLAQDFGVSGVPKPLLAPTYPEPLFRALKWALLPAMVPIWAYARVKQAIS
jgi:hypothetical protein